MRKFSIPLVAVLFLMTLPHLAEAADFVERAFEESDDLLLNPDCGWVAYNYEDSYASRKSVAGDKEPFALASVIYTRHVSKNWLADDGRFEDSAPLKLLQDWMDHGRYVAFRIYANTLDDLPVSLRDKVRPVHQKGRTGVTYWDTDYIEDHRKLVTFLGKQLGNSPYLAYVDIGAVGDTGGEWCFGNRRAFTLAGLNDKRFFELARTFVEMYREAFPHTRLFISYEAISKAGQWRGEVLALLEKHEIGLRDDGLGGWPYPKEFISWDWPMPMLYRKTPILFEGGGRGGGVYGWKMQGKDPEKILEWALRRSPPSFINLAGAESKSEKACVELRDVLIKYGQKLGYRFVLLNVRTPTSLQHGQNFEVISTWANRGIAPCYGDHKMQVALYDREGKLFVVMQAQPSPPTTEWLPRREITVRTSLRCPADVPAGAYSLRLALSLENFDDPARLLNIATKGAEEDGRYLVGSVHVIE